MEKKKIKRVTTSKKKTVSKKTTKKKGFTLIEVLAVIIIIGIIAIVAVPMVSNYIEGASTTAYKTYEKSMEDSAKNKLVDCLEEGCLELDKGDSEKVYLSELIDGGYIDNMKDPDSNEMCRVDISYVTVGKDYGDTYTYDVCLYCGEYESDNCTRVVSDGDNPVCGEVTGSSTRWTNQDRAISVQCSDATSGCTKGIFTRIFKDTTEIGDIKISDRTGNETTCGNIEVYVDKTNPTCEIEVEGTTCVDSVIEGGVEVCNIYGNGVKAKIRNQADAHSGMLTYGMGTSISYRDYNKKDELSLGTGITTVIGYVKDQAGNEGICTKDVKVATTPTVTYDSNGGNSCDPSSKVVMYGGTYGELCTPTRTGYTFAGWWTTAAGGDRIEASTKVIRPLDHILYAHWTPNTYTVDFNENLFTSVAKTDNGVLYSKNGFFMSSL